MMLRVDHTKLTVSLLGGKNKLQKSMYNIMPTAEIYVCVCMRIYPHTHTHLYMNRIHLEPCCSTARSVMMDMPSGLSNTGAAGHSGPLTT